MYFLVCFPYGLLKLMRINNKNKTYNEGMLSCIVTVFVQSIYMYISPIKAKTVTFHFRIKKPGLFPSNHMHSAGCLLFYHHFRSLHGILAMSVGVPFDPSSLEGWFPK